MSYEDFKAGFIAAVGLIYTCSSDRANEVYEDPDDAMRDAWVKYDPPKRGKRRFTFDPNSGVLVGRDGEPLGRVVGITIDPGDRGEGGLGKQVNPSTTEEEEGSTAQREGGAGGTEKRPTATQLEAEAVHRVWAYWVEITGKKQQLDDKRKRIIRNALKLVGEDATKRALLGLTRSPHHQGQNEQRRPYMEIRYALKGLKDESDDERIEKAITWAAEFAPGKASVDSAKVHRWIAEVQYTMSLPHRPEKERGKAAWQNLKAAGFTIVQLDKSPWVRVER